MDREDGSEVILGTFAWTTQRPQATVVVVVLGVIIGDRPIQGIGVGQLLGTVKVEVKPPPTPEKARNAEPGASKEEKTKWRGGYRGWRATRASLANVSQDVGYDEYVDKRRGSFQ